jgi:hypothetical protein
VKLHALKASLEFRDKPVHYLKLFIVRLYKSHALVIARLVSKIC